MIDEALWLNPMFRETAIVVLLFLFAAIAIRRNQAGAPFSS